jgi:hypothetical protein
VEYLDGVGVALDAGVRDEAMPRNASVSGVDVRNESVYGVVLVEGIGVTARGELEPSSFSSVAIHVDGKWLLKVGVFWLIWSCAACKPASAFLSTLRIHQKRVLKRKCP